MKKILLLSLFASANIYAAGYKVPEQSTDSVALAASNLAKSYGADASYFNPANMSFLDDKTYLELGLNRYSLSKITFENQTSNFKSKPTNLFAPNLYAISPKYNDFRFGLSLVNPAGLKIRWDDPYPASTAKEFELRVTELSPSVSYRVSDSTSVGASLRFIMSKGVVENDFILVEQPVVLSDHKFVKGDSKNFGYSLALSHKFNENFNFAVIYRSKVNLKLKGNASLQVNANNPVSYNGGASVVVPMPATLSLATSYTDEKFDLLFAIDRTFWSAFKELDFNFDGELAVPFPKFIDDAPIHKHYRDSNAYRLGYVYKGFDNLKILAGIAYDERAQKSDTIGFDLPDTKAMIYSAGLNYDFNENFSLGASLLYQHRFARNSEHIFVPKDPKMPLPPYANVVGKFKQSYGLITGLSLKYKF